MPGLRVRDVAAHRAGLPDGAVGAAVPEAGAAVRVRENGRRFRARDRRVWAVRAGLWLLAAFTAGCAAGGLLAGSALWFGASLAVAAGTWIGLDITRPA